MADARFFIPIRGSSPARRSSPSLSSLRLRHRFLLGGELSAVGLLDTFCVNVVDWGSRGVLAVACEETVHLWRPPRETSPREYLPLPEEEEEGLVTSVSWTPDGARLALGMGNSEVQLWDVGRGTVVWRRPGLATGGASSIVSALSWRGEAVLTSGAMSGAVQNHDIRVSAAADGAFTGHRAGVCGLQWAECGSQLASSDGNGSILIWDPSTSGKKTLHRLKKDGKGPVRALSWCPSRSRLLASAGMGEEEDPAITFWNTQTATCCAKSIGAHSSVLGLAWSGDGEEVMSAHGDG